MTAQKLGKKVLIIDGDMGLANVDVVLGLQPRYNINDVIEGRISLDKIVLGTNLGFDVIPSGSGITQLTNLSYVNRIDLLEQVQKLTTQYNTILIDTGAGISDTVLHLKLHRERDCGFNDPRASRDDGCIRYDESFKSRKKHHPPSLGGQSVAFAFGRRKDFCTS